MSKVKNYFHEVKKELKRVKWPTVKEVTKNIGATIFFILFFALFFYLVDIIFAYTRGIFN